MFDRTMAERLREAALYHHKAEMRLPPHDWADWYAVYLRARSLGAEPAAAIAVADVSIIEPCAV